jgi:6-phosphogluconolactonase (cycloisomerase 2 family)
LLLGAALLALPAPANAAGRGTTGNPSSFRSHADIGAVYSITNDPAGNSVIVFDRFADGTMSPAGVVASGGTGTGASLGDQGAVVLGGEGNQWLFAVNAGSGSISSFAVQKDGLALVDTSASGGVTPISIAVRGHLLYVLNAGDATHPDNITGFFVKADGQLWPIPGSTRPLSADSTGPAQVSFDSDGDNLVVTEKATNVIDTYAVEWNGLVDGPQVHPSSGMTPYGFGFAKRDTLIVSEAVGAVSSYHVMPDGGLTTLSPSIGTHQMAACWIAVTDDGQYAYATNAGSGSITGYQVAPSGAIQLLNTDGVTASLGEGAHPTDMALSRNSRFLYVRSGGIWAYQVNADGSLTLLGTTSSLPATAAGLAAR